jgi:hypothetical protein
MTKPNTVPNTVSNVVEALKLVVVSLLTQETTVKLMSEMS